MSVTESTPVTALGLSPAALRRLMQRDIKTVGRLCATAADALRECQRWMSAHERRCRHRADEEVLREVRLRLGECGLALRGEGPMSAEPDAPLEALGLSVRATNVALRLGATTLGRLAALSVEEVLGNSFREAALREIQEALAKRGLWLADDGPA